MRQPPAFPRLLPTALALFLVALGLRPQIVAVGPLLPDIQADLAIGHAVAGLLATIPVLCMGVFALIGPWLGRLLGVERAIAAGVGGIALFGLLRAVAPETLTILLLTFGVGVGVAVVGPLLPTVVHQRAANVAALTTGVYAGGIVVGASLGAALAVPLADFGDTWRVPLAAFSLAALLTLGVWIALERPGRAPPTDAQPPRLPWRRGRAWALALLFAAQSTLFYAVAAWLPTIYVERGWAAADAGLLLALVNGISLFSTFGGPALAQRWGSRRLHLLVASGFSLAGVLGIAVLPDLALPWVALLGLGLGAVFPLALTLPVDMAERPGDAGGLAAIMLFGGYALSAGGPVALGWVREATGDFGVGVWLLVGIALALAAMSWWFVPAQLGRRAAGAG
jgi:MFS transporter, CP family, cyanate transporter